MIEVHAKQFKWQKSNGIWCGIAEASELGLSPGEWPQALIVEGNTINKLFLDMTLPHPDSIAKANQTFHEYTDHEGTFIKIFND